MPTHISKIVDIQLAKLENTLGMKYRLNNIKFTDGKALRDSVIFYWLDK